MKKVTAKIGTYQKDGKEKGRYVEVGAIGNSQHGEYLILHPHIDIAGIAIQQKAIGMGREDKSGVICSIWDGSNNSGGEQNQATAAPSDSPDPSDDLPF